jgi:hypothetical protein
MPGARCTRSPVCKVESTRVVATGPPEHPAFPHAMVLTAYFVLSPATNSSCHRHQRIKVCPHPVGPTRLRQLDTSNGCQDHTPLPSASCIVRQRAVDDSRAKPALPSQSRARRCRVHRIPPRVNDDGQRPSGGRDGEGYRSDLGQARIEIFLQRGLDWWNQQTAPFRQITPFCS